MVVLGGRVVSYERGTPAFFLTNFGESTVFVAPVDDGVAHPGCQPTLVRPLWEGTTRAEDAQGTPTQSHLSPSILVCEENPSI